jgi:hypothetical protein
MSLYQGMDLQSKSIDEINESIKKGIEIIMNSSERISLIPEITQKKSSAESPIEFNMYNIDNVLRRSKPLQHTKEGIGKE